MLFTFFGKNFKGHIVDGGVVKNDNASVGTRFDVNAEIFAKFIVCAAEIVANGLNGYIKFVGNAVHRTIGKTVFELTEFVESDCLAHNLESFEGVIDLFLDVKLRLFFEATK